MKYNHAYTIAFSLISNHPEGDDVTPAMFRAAIERRMGELDQSPEKFEWGEATGAPFDTYKDDGAETVLAIDPAQSTGVAIMQDGKIVASHWDNHPDYPVEDWQYEVANGDTRRSYHDWCESKAEQDADGDEA